MEGQPASAIPRTADQLRDSLARPEAGRAGQVAGELAALHVVLIEEIGRRASAAQDDDALVSSLVRLAEQFGSIQAEFAGLIASAAPIPGAMASGDGAELDGWLRTLAAGQQRYGVGFALALIEVDGLELLSDAHGPEAAARILKAVAGVIERQVRSADRAFKLEDGEFYVVAPQTSAGRLMPMIERLVELIYNSQASQGPRIAISAGVVDCPADGSTADELIASAHEAGYAAKAAGIPAARLDHPPGDLQDP